MSKGHGLIIGGRTQLNGPGVLRSFGAHRIATYLRQHDYDVEVLDFAFGWTLEELKDFVRSRVYSKTRFIGFSATLPTPSHLLIVPLFNWIKETYPHIITVTGSQSFWYLRFIPADYTVVGWGEKAMLEILEGNVKTEQRTTGPNTRTVVEALHKYPAYPMQDLNIEYEDRDFMKPTEMHSMELSRGCIFNCAFCEYPIRGVRSDHTVSAESFERNMKTVYDKWGIKNHFISDDTFNDYTAKIVKYADVVEKLPFDPNFASTIRADLLVGRPEDLEHLARMRVNQHFYGIESFHRPAAKFIGKGGDPDKIKEKLIETRQYMLDKTGIYRGTISLIMGLPHETEEHMMETMEWLRTYWHTEAIGINPYQMQQPGLKSEGPSKIEDTPEKFGYEVVAYEDLGVNFDEIKPWLMRNHLTDDQRDRIRLQAEHHAGVQLREGAVLPWRNNVGLNFWDMVKFSIREYFAHDTFYEYGMSHYEFGEWLPLGYTLEELMQPRTVLGERPPIELRDAFIEDYKQKKMNNV